MCDAGQELNNALLLCSLQIKQWLESKHCWIPVRLKQYVLCLWSSRWESLEAGQMYATTYPPLVLPFLLRWVRGSLEANFSSSFHSLSHSSSVYTSPDCTHKRKFWWARADAHQHNPYLLFVFIIFIWTCKVPGHNILYPWEVGLP